MDDPVEAAFTLGIRRMQDKGAIALKNVEDAKGHDAEVLYSGMYHGYMGAVSILMEELGKYRATKMGLDK